MQNLLFIIFIVLFLFKVSFCSAYEDSFEKSLNLWPFLVFYKNKKTNIKKIEILGPFFYKYKFPEENGLFIRPFYSSVSNSQGRKAYFLSPLGVYKSDNETSTLKLFPILKKTWHKAKEEKNVKNWEFFPIFAGVTSDNQTYGGFFPFYGKLKNRLGAKEITFFLWPVYSKAQYEKYTSENFFWPFIRIIKPNEPKSKEYNGFKIWPIYGHFKERLMERTFILWPFYIKEKDPFSQKLIIFPLYIRENTDSYNKWIILWPFFQKIYAKNSCYKQIDAPWPFYRKIEGKNINGIRIWPFYGCVKRKNSSDSFILWPLYFYKTDNIYKGKFHYKKVEHRFLLLSKSTYINKNNTIKKEIRLWPFVYDYQLDSNSIHLKYWYFPAILPFYDEGIERNYSAFLKLMEYYKKNKYSFFKLLWGLYRCEKFGNRETQELAFFLRVIKDKNTNYVEFLEGLLGIGKIEGKSILKILYINFRD
ncbi:hypothetical protein [Thermodesulfobacterium hydrogeniphilum]|uniref:hypothetical protein n=1 Tax=Thermodesulfobacterium hydrogeniphilum TaxID=161156 RepID=UPI00056E270D|nr:hypothetical protein [Thermodesulfobacterium hydrogeniphilum]